MADEGSLGERLLKTNGINAAGISESDRETLRRLLERDRKRMRRMRLLTMIGWGLFAGTWIFAAVVVNAEATVFSHSVALFLIYAALCLAAIFTISFALRAYLFHVRESNLHLIEIEARLGIEARLAGIEERLKRLETGK